MNKPLLAISAAIDCYSGYSAKSREWIKSLIELKGNEFDIKILSQRWGSTTRGFLTNNPEWSFLKQYIHEGPLPYQPDVWIQDTVCNEFQKVGKYNIGFCSGIETSVCDVSWIEGCNRMDLIITSSEHSKSVFENTVFEKRQGDTVLEIIKLKTKCVVLFEGFNKEISKLLTNKTEFSNQELYSTLKSIPESFAFLVFGHWLQGDIGEDRKNMGLTIKAFFEIFKNKKDKPALVLKVNGASTSYLDEFEIKKKIEAIKNTVNSKDLPNVYLMHGEFSDTEINEIHNHPKIKAMISLTKGEGYGRPLLEFALTNKPIIVSAWSGHLDFLKKDFTAFVNGDLKPIHPSAQVPGMLIENSLWFSPNHGEFGMLVNDVYNNYNKWLQKSKQQGNYCRSKFSKEKMKDKLREILDENLPKIPKFMPLNIPVKKLSLPTLNK